MKIHQQAKAFARDIVFNTPWVFPIYYKFRWSPRNTIERVLDEYAKSRNKVFFVQIGANDGLQDDSFNFVIRGNRWRGILLEPQRAVFKKLKQNLRRFRRLRLENAAISESSGERALYQISFSKERWASGLSSFERKCVEAHFENGYVQEQTRAAGLTLPENRKTWIEEERVFTISFSDLIRKHSISRIDVLLIDTEGFDYEILKLFDFSKSQPEIIIYEHKHLSDDDNARAETLLATNGYAFEKLQHDTLAVLNGPDHLPDAVGLFSGDAGS